ncbi:putative membrane protein [Antricoccus suffuscus]|uniref:Putative membrane protein n=1 Tax=Antricoccus suffuscus TaxID=1629062 RepID=A0A2T0ZYR6_9ACTN|nr:glycosyltransferase 87 family protein [Antricoccus suffuscus]PRZ41501.1 putative membrane protein [Antricoccus suffuscus]
MIPTWEDPVARAASTIIGGPWGKHAEVGKARFFTPLRILLAFATLTLLFAWVKERPCAYDPWTNNTQLTHMCYSDVAALWHTDGLDANATPYFDYNPGEHPADPSNPSYPGAVQAPVLTGAVMYIANAIAAPVNALSGSIFDKGRALSGYEGYFVVACLFLGLCYYASVWATAKTAGRRVWDAALVALSPLVFVQAFTDWTLFAVALTSVAVMLWVRRRSRLAGLFFGLAISAAIYPIVLLIALALLAWRTGSWRPALRAIGVAIVTWLVVNVPVMLGAWDGWRLAYAGGWGRDANPASLWDMAQRALSSEDQFAYRPLLRAGTLDILVIVSLGVLVVAIGWLVLTAPTAPTFAQVAFLLVAAYLLTSKDWSAQYSLYLLPLAALALPDWRALIPWQVTEAVVWLMTMLWLIQRNINAQNVDLAAHNKTTRLLSGVDYPWLGFALVVRAAAVIVLAVLVIRSIRSSRPTDPSRISRDPSLNPGDPSLTAGPQPRCPRR